MLILIKGISRNILILILIAFYVLWIVVYFCIKNDFHFAYNPFRRLLLSQRLLVVVFFSLLIDGLIRLLESSSPRTFTFTVVTFGQEVNLFLCNPSHTRTHLECYFILLYFIPAKPISLLRDACERAPWAAPDHQTKNEVLWWPILHSGSAFSILSSADQNPFLHHCQRQYSPDRLISSSSWRISKDTIDWEISYTSEIEYKLSPLDQSDKVNI